MRTIFVGDIHGCRDPFAELLDALAFVPGSDRLLLCGDILTRGPDPRGVWELVQQTGAEMVMGNHDLFVLQRLERLGAGVPIQARTPDKRADIQRLRPIADALLPWLRVRPYAMDEPRFLLVHAGIHPGRGLAGSTIGELVSIRTWPPVPGIVGPRWHRYVTPLPDKPIVFGHDAPGGLVVRRRADGAPWLLGLDTGCVYGGDLSAWLLEADRLVQVPGKR